MSSSQQPVHSPSQQSGSQVKALDHNAENGSDGKHDTITATATTTSSKKKNNHYHPNSKLTIDVPPAVQSSLIREGPSPSSRDGGDGGDFELFSEEEHEHATTTTAVAEWPENPNEVVRMLAALPNLDPAYQILLQVANKIKTKLNSVDGHIITL